MPDPGEPPAEGQNESAGTVPGWPVGPDIVHLIIWNVSLIDDGPGSWSTECPADIENLPAGERARKVVPTLATINCPSCIVSRPDTVAAVNAITADSLQQEGLRRVDLLAFLRWLRDEKGIVLADYAGGVNLKPYPSSFDAQLTQEFVRHVRG